MDFYIRLLNVHTFTLHEFAYADTPRYVVASHRWANNPADENPFVKGDRSRFDTQSPGFQKISAFCDQVVRRNRRAWLWIDTCCLDKTNAREETAAVASMFKYYEEAGECLVWLRHVLRPTFEDMKKDEWFYRGWTLQELLAPSLVIFYAEDWSVLGCKRFRHSPQSADISLDLPVLHDILASVTGIDISVLDGTRKATEVPFEERIQWLQGRTTKVEEDQANCLFGLFGIHTYMGDVIRATPDASIREEEIDRSQMGRVVEGFFPSLPGGHNVGFGNTRGSLVQLQRFVIMGSYRKDTSNEPNVIAIPVKFYDNLGVGAPGVKKSEHAIAYTRSEAHEPTGQERARRGEDPMLMPIRIVSYDRTGAFDQMARIHFAHSFEFLYGIPSTFHRFGKVHEDSMTALSYQYRDTIARWRRTGSQPSAANEVLAGPA